MKDIQIKKRLHIKSLGPFMVLVVFFIVTTLLSSSFLTLTNLINILRQSSIVAALAAGLTIVIITEGIDLSVGAIIAISGIIVAKSSSMPLVVSLALALGAGCLIGIINGLIITKLRIPAFIATLSTMLAIRGVAYLVVPTSSLSVARTSDAFMYIAKGELFGVLPFPTFLIIVLYIITAFILRYTDFGRNVYSVGGNEEAASMMGINCDRVKIGAYMFCGLTASIAGLILTARLGTALPGAGTGYEIKAIATVVLGGTYLTGGRGSIVSTFWAALTMGLITNMFNMVGNLSTWIENVLMGLLLLFIVLVQSPETKAFFNKAVKKLHIIRECEE